jgi:hypothetical protein
MWGGKSSLENGVIGQVGSRLPRDFAHGPFLITRFSFERTRSIQRGIQGRTFEEMITPAFNFRQEAG